MEIQFLEKISDIGKKEWDAVVNSDYPFLKYNFLKILETSKCVSEENGWSPFHIVVKEKNAVIAVMPLYIKTDSQGEFIFDWSWADAYYRNGLNYYPKLVSAIPFTPASGPRLSISDDNKIEEVTKLIHQTIESISGELDFSSMHILLPKTSELKEFENSGFSIRTSYSFHWFNNEYRIFDDFLNDLTSRQRKNIRKERKKIADQGVKIEKVRGKDISEEMIVSFFNFYQITYLKRGMNGYLNLEFFKEVIKLIPESILLVTAINASGDYVAAALNFYDSKKLYGRYWGCLEEYDSLHFETCYYQGIEFCIENNLMSFDPGVQGEHKIKRGFLPIETYSAHWIKDLRFKEAIDDFLQKETVNIKQYNQQCTTLLPFKKDMIEKIYEQNTEVK
jgi:predicted N-acyltransferase